MNPNEMNVCFSFLEQKYPDVYADMIDHLNSYQKFMEIETGKWIKLQDENPELVLPLSIQRLLSEEDWSINLY